MTTHPNPRLNPRLTLGLFAARGPVGQPSAPAPLPYGGAEGWTAPSTSAQTLGPQARTTTL